jgi:hypothetical protein
MVSHSDRLANVAPATLFKRDLAPSRVRQAKMLSFAADPVLIKLETV